MKELRILHLHVTREYWEQMRDGKKLWEYRLADKWFKRIAHGNFDEVWIWLGYPKGSCTEKRLRFYWRGFKREEITHKHFGEKSVWVVSIDVSKRIPEGESK